MYERRWIVAKDARTGRFITQREADVRKDTTYRMTVRRLWHDL